MSGLRLELFVADVAASVAFYRDALGFTIEREEPGYVPMRLGDVRIAIGAQSGLPAGHHFGSEALGRQKGVGVEIVVEVDDVEEAHRRAVASGYPLSSELQRRPWGLRDFRIIDPDGDYVRVTSRA
jgi:catechol 2,3-dioxygenase-like lactoylglutathione lyase family enzyme